jgi:predicted DNA-binding transcriptional regulator AlpA
LTAQSSESEVKGIEPLLDAKDVKSVLNIALPTVYKMVERGQLPCVQWEGPGPGTRRKTTIRFRKKDILDFIESHIKY